jgi:hypothetical protein
VGPQHLWKRCLRLLLQLHQQPGCTLPRQGRRLGRAEVHAHLLLQLLRRLVLEAAQQLLQCLC